MTMLWAISTHIDKFLVDRYFSRGNTSILLVFTALIGVLFLPLIAVVRPGAIDLSLRDDCYIRCNANCNGSRLPGVWCQGSRQDDGERPCVSPTCLEFLHVGLTQGRSPSSNSLFTHRSSLFPGRVPAC